MTNREKLRENYEDSVLALLMDEFAESEGKRFIEENERLRQDPSAAVPEDVERRALQLINREFAKKNRAHTGKKLLRFLARIAIAAVIAALLFGAAFALSETVRAGTLNFLMQMDERIATWQFVEDEGAASDGQSGALEVMVNWLPEGYAESQYTEITPVDVVIDCTNDAGGLISVSVHESEDFMHTLDLEDADYFTDAIVQGQQGMLIMKNDIFRIVWPHKSSALVVDVESANVDSNTLLLVAESISIIE